MKVSLNEFGRGMFIKIIREWTGLTQQEFAKRLGKSTRTIQEYEAGSTNVSTILIMLFLIKEKLIMARKNNILHLIITKQLYLVSYRISVKKY